MPIINGMEIHDVRKKNLQWLIKNHFGGVKKKAAEACGWQPIVISTLASDKESSFKPMGRKRAEVIESATGYPIGWMDVIHEDDTLVLLDRQNAASMLKGESYKAIQDVSNIAVPEKMKSGNVFAMIEDMEGLAPLINKGDRVFIKPELPIKADTNSMFWVNNKPLIGMVTMSPAGMSLKFFSNAPGWEMVSVKEDDYIGRVIAIDPIWAINQRED